MMTFFKHLQPIFCRVTCIIHKIDKTIYFVLRFFGILYIYLVMVGIQIIVK